MLFRSPGFFVVHCLRVAEVAQLLVHFGDGIRCVPRAKLLPYSVTEVVAVPDGGHPVNIHAVTVDLVAVRGVTGCDEDGRQMYEFGSSEGILKEQMKLGKAGTPAERDYIIHIDVLIKGGEVYDRRLPNAAFKACDHIVSKIREVLKKQEAKHADEVHEFYDIIRPDAKRVALVKQVAGQGAMYDNLLFPNDPSGFEGGISIIDLGNMPVVLSPNEYRNDILRSLT